MLKGKEKKTVNIQSFIRIRPLNDRELKLSKDSCIANKGNQIYITTSKQTHIINEKQIQNSDTVKQFQFSKVFDSKTTQTEIFEQVGRKVVDNVLKGFNSSIFAYGQTGAGKTYTMQGSDLKQPSEIEGLYQRILKQFLSNKAAIVSLEFIEVYNEVVSDLSKKNQRKNLKIREVYGENTIRIENLNRYQIDSYKDGIKLFYTALKNRVVHQTYMSAQSSRSHSIYRFHVLNAVEGQNCTFTQAELNLVDLAGSERTKKSGVTGMRLLEASKINLSLSSIGMIVHALSRNSKSKKQHIPYRNSKLTRILKNSFGGNSMTSFIGCLSPVVDNCNESLSTLRFMNICQQIKNKVITKKTVNYYGHINKPKKVKKKPKKPEGPWKDLKPKIHNYMLETKQGKLRVLDNCVEDPEKERLVILMHGCPSNCTNLLHFFKPLTYYNYKVVAFDMKGYGESPGERLPSRSDRIHDSGGPVDCAISVMRALGYSKAHFGGYDWGAGVALGIAAKRPKLVKSIISFLPSYTPENLRDMKSITPKILILWVKQDLFHSWNNWKKYAKLLPNKTIKIINIPFYKEKISYGAYEKINDEIGRHIMMFLGIPDPMGEIQLIKQNIYVQDKDCKGNEFTRKQLLLFQEDAKLINIDIVGNKSIVEYKNILEKTLNKSKSDYVMFCKRVLNKEQTVTSAIRNLPKTDLVALQNYSFFVKHKIWACLPNNINSMLNSPRYFKGLRVIALLPSSGFFGDPNFLKFRKNKTEQFLVFDCRIETWEDKVVKLRSISDPEAIVKVSEDSILKYNHPQTFGVDVNGKTVFEDGLKCDYSSNLVKAKIFEIAIKLAPLVEKLDFSGTEEDIIAIQKSVVLVIRSSLNIISFYRGVDKGRIGRTDSIGQMSWNGQGQCHGLSSTMSAYLIVFGPIFGIDILYRGGFSFFGLQEEKSVSNLVEKHQWIEVSLRPSGKRFVVDLWYEDQEQNQKFLFMPLEKAMANLSYPHPKILLSNTLKTIEANEILFN